MAEKQLEKEISEIKAFAKGVHASPRKARLVADVVRGLTVAKALDQLRYVNRKVHQDLIKLINSAVSNAKHNFEIDENYLFIKEISVDGGQFFKRYKPRAQGRAFPIRRRTSNFNLTLGVSEEPFYQLSAQAKSDKKETEKSTNTDKDKTEQPKAEKKVEQKKDSETKPPVKKQEHDQSKPRQDENVKAQRQKETFDRRGNM